MWSAASGFDLSKGLASLGDLAAGAVDAAGRLKADVEASIESSLKQAAEGDALDAVTLPVSIPATVSDGGGGESAQPPAEDEEEAPAVAERPASTRGKGRGRSLGAVRVSGCGFAAMQGSARVWCVACVFARRCSDRHRRSTRTSRAGTRRASPTWAKYSRTRAACERAWLRLGGVASPEPQMRRVLDLLRAAGPSIG